MARNPHKAHSEQGGKQLRRTLQLLAEFSRTGVRLYPFRRTPALDRKQDFETVWNVPYPRNSFFTGRERVLSDLRRAFEAGKKAVALAGLGGMGKTATAKEYAYRHRAKYTAVFWARAETRDTLLADFASMAAALEDPAIRRG